MSEEISLKEYLKAVGPKHKFFANRTEVDGIWFDSKRESEQYRELKILERCGEITNLTLQPEFPIVVNNTKICTYRADFSFFQIRTGEAVVMDVKSKATKTPVYELKKKLFCALYGRKITEVF